MRECWLVNGTLVRWRCSLPHGFCASERLTGVIRGFTPAIVTHRVPIASGCTSPDNFDESIGARERENAASMWSWSR